MLKVMPAIFSLLWRQEECNAGPDDADTTRQDHGYQKRILPVDNGRQRLFLQESRLAGFNGFVDKHLAFSIKVLADTNSMGDAVGDLLYVFSGLVARLRRQQEP